MANIKPTLLRRSILVVALLGLALALYLFNAGDSLHLIQGQTMGTTYSVKWVGEGADQLQPEVEAALEHVNDLASTWRKDSQLSKINAEAAGQWQTASPELLLMLNLAAEIHQKTGGRYDVSIGPLVNLWGFGAGVERFAPPAQKQIERARAKVGFQRVQLGDARILLPEGMYLDLSSIAKGYAVDLLAELMHQRSIENYIVEIGGELRLSGTGPEQRPWSIGIESPQRLGETAARMLFTSASALATSGDYNNAFVHKGQQYGHLIDPSSGWPVQHAASVTVHTSSCMQADAWATALSVLVPDEAMQLAEEQGLGVYFIWRLGDGTTESAQTSHWALGN